MKTRLFIWTIVFFFVFLQRGNAMVDYNIQMRQIKSENTACDKHYTISKAENIKINDGSNVESKLFEKVNYDYNSDLEKRNKSTKSNFDENILRDLGEKTYTVETIVGNPITVTNGTLKVNNSTTLTNYIYSNKNLKFSNGYPLKKTIEVTNELATVSSSTNRLNPITVNLKDEFTLFLNGLKPNFDSNDTTVKYILNFYSDTQEISVRFNSGKIDLEYRANDISIKVLALAGLTWDAGDDINIVLTQNDKKLTLGACVNNDKNKIVTSNMISKPLQDDYTFIILDYKDKNVNLQGNSEYQSISIFNRYIKEIKPMLIEKDLVNYDIITRFDTNIEGTANEADWNEKICGEVSNILYEPDDRLRPYKIAVGGYNGAYNNNLIGKTSFAYSTDLKTWSYVPDSPVIDVYTEDGTLIKFRDKYFFYAETIPNRNIKLWVSDDFKKWNYIGKVASPDKDPYLVDLPSAKVSSGSPTAIVKDNKVYLFIEYGYTSNLNHSNKVLVSKDGINFRTLSTVPDILKMESVSTILPYPEWTINNFESICEKEGKYYAWVSITNKTVSPKIFSMYEMVSTDLINWEFTGANFKDNYDYISFGCLSDSYEVIANGKYTEGNYNKYEILVVKRYEELLPDELKVNNVNLLDKTFNISTANGEKNGQ
ncbi:hypothetical protein [Oceanirhabdus seepicola]|uniref:Glycosyl hydrolase family 32 N-terminal domain-containing protein n=1 Tax=Oceanirhabdus seepicola TaxID=2828781 RepID=A0A9J6P1A7_9CLOT|nr:hypothetical protein [Oceanirhabdus seepicola]MCM1990514.1 hypothetical protein [Oceanirhabdus seepicola]